MERFFTGKMLQEDEEPLFEHFQTRYPRAMASAMKIRTFIEEKYQTTIPNEEVTYLAVHIYRLLGAVPA